MNVFVTADTHFYHERVVKFSKRPFQNAQEMNVMLIKKWNDRVSKDDIVFHLGDFVFKASKYQIKKIKDQLNGTIILVPGNHDNKRILRSLGFVVTGYTLQVGNLLMSHHPRKVNDGLVNLHGHLHQLPSYHGINACVDVNNFEPQPIEKFVKMANEMLGGNGEC